MRVLLSMLRVRVVLVLMVCVCVCVCRVCVCVACVDLTLTTNPQMFIGQNCQFCRSRPFAPRPGVCRDWPTLCPSSHFCVCSATASRNLTSKIRERIVRDEHTYTQRTPPQPTIT